MRGRGNLESFSCLPSIRLLTESFLLINPPLFGISARARVCVIFACIVYCRCLTDAYSNSSRARVIGFFRQTNVYDVQVDCVLELRLCVCARARTWTCVFVFVRGCLNVHACANMCACLRARMNVSVGMRARERELDLVHVRSTCACG